MPTRSEILRARRKAVGGARPRCRRGKSCSAACINRDKHCLVDAPTPVAGALPKAVRAIQSRKPRPTPQERRKASQDRRQLAKETLKGAAELARQRSEFRKERNSLMVQIRRSILSEEFTKEDQLRAKLQKLESEVGTKLRVDPAKPLSRYKENNRWIDTRNKFKRRMISLSARMKEAANPRDPRIAPNRKLYSELEKKLLSYAKRDIPLWNHYSLNPLKGYEEGEIWRREAEERKLSRASRLKSAYRKLVEEAMQAAREGNLKKYREAESKVLKVAEKAKSQLNLRDRYVPKKGSLWKDARVPKTLKELLQSMDDSLAAGDLAKYNRAEAKFLKVREAYLKDIMQSGGNTDKLWLEVGNRVDSKRGDIIGTHLSKLERDIRYEAEKNNRREYNKLESAYMRLSPDYKKGTMWKDAVQARAKRYIPTLKMGMTLAARDKDRKKYNKFERTLLRLDPDAKKGAMWREVRFGAYYAILGDKLKDAAAEGNRKKYDKMERVLFRAKPDGDNVKGKVWKNVRTNVAVEKLARDMEKAAESGDRNRYNYLEDKFLKIRNTVDRSTIRDYDLRYAQRGVIWQNVQDSKALSGLKETLDAGKRVGVSDLKIKGGPEDFYVISNVLGNKLALSVSPNQSTSFTVNDSYTASDKLSRREVIAITREVTRQYTEIVKQLPEGTVFSVTAAEGDERKDMRIEAYTKFGFSPPDYNGYMYGMVRGGRIVPIDEDEYYDARS